MKNILLKILDNKALAVVAALGVVVVLTGTTYACKGIISKYSPAVSKKAQEQPKTEVKTEVKAVETAVVPQPAPEAAPVVAPAKVVTPAPVKKATPPTEVKKSQPAPATGGVSSISLQSSGNMVKWITSGYSAKGFKVVWSKVSGPTYPTRATDQYHYLSSPDTYKDYIDDFDGPGTYYVRVCEYLGGACGAYSNQTTVTLP